MYTIPYGVLHRFTGNKCYNAVQFSFEKNVLLMDSNNIILCQANELVGSSVWNHDMMTFYEGMYLQIILILVLFLDWRRIALLHISLERCIFTEDISKHNGPRIRWWRRSWQWMLLLLQIYILLSYDILCMGKWALTNYPWTFENIFIDHRNLMSELYTHNPWLKSSVRSSHVGQMFRC